MVESATVYAKLPNQRIIKNLDWKTSYIYRNALQRFEENNLHIAQFGATKTDDFTISRKPMVDDKSDDKDQLLEEEDFYQVTRLINKARAPGKMTQGKQDMVPLMRSFSDKAHYTFKSLLRKLIDHKFADFEFAKMCNEDAGSFLELDDFHK